MDRRHRQVETPRGGNEELLLKAACSGDANLLESLLQKGLSPDSRDKDGLTALYWACCRGHVEVCWRLLHGGCDVNAKGKAGATALMACVDNGHVSCVRLLLKHGLLRLDDSNERGDTALHQAAYRGFREIVSLLCQAGADTSLRNKNNQTALEEAFIKGNMKCAWFLNEFNNKKQTNQGGHEEDIQTTPKKIYQTQSSIPGANARTVLAFNRSSHGQPVVGATPGGSLRLPECVDERSSPATSVGRNSTTDICYHSTDSEPLPSGDFAKPSITRVDRPPGRHDSGLDSIGPQSGTPVSFSNVTDGVPESTCGFHPQSLNPSSIDSQYQSSSSCEGSIRDPQRSLTTGDIYSPQASLDNATISQVGLPPNIPAHHTLSSRYISNQPENATKAKEIDSKVTIASDTKDNTIRDMVNHGSVDSSVHSISHHKQKEPAKGNAKNRDKGEILNGLKMSSFIENLQMRVLMLEDSLNQERTTKVEMRKEISRLKGENIKLKSNVKNLSCQCSELSSRLSRKT